MYMHVFVCLVCDTLYSLSLSVSAPKKQGSKRVERSASKACGRSGGGRSRQPGVYVCVCDCVCIVFGTVCVTHSLVLLVSAPKKRDNSAPEVDDEWYYIAMLVCRLSILTLCVMQRALLSI